MGNTGEKEISFGSTDGKGFTINAGKRVFNQVNRTLNKGTMAIEIIPVLSTARNTGVNAQVFVRVNIRAFVRIGSAGIGADTEGISRAFDFDGIMADIFESEGTIFTTANTMEDKGGFIFGTKRSTVFVKIRMSRAGVTRVERNTHSVKMKIIA